MRDQEGDRSCIAVGKVVVRLGKNGMMRKRMKRMLSGHGGAYGIERGGGGLVRQCGRRRLVCLRISSGSSGLAELKKIELDSL
jgi:hypothetical protein